MKNSVLRFCAGLLAAVLLSMAVVPCYAVSDKYTSTGTFWQAVADKWYFNGTFIPAVIGTVSDKVCSESGDKKHHGSLKSYEQNSDKSYTAICDFCSAEFPVYDADLSAAYNDYVETLPASGYNSDGSLLYSPTPYYLYYRKQGGALGSTHVWGCPHWEALGDNRKASLTGLKAQFSCLCEDCAFIVSPQDGASSYEGVSGTIYSYYLLIAPIDGYYTPLNDIAATGRFVSSSKTENFVVPYSGSEVFYSAGQRVEDIACSFSLYGTGYGSGSLLSIQFVPPVYKVVPSATLSGDTYSTTTRPTSITGGNYGIVGDNGQLTKVEDNSTIVNETNNTFYNPATGTTVPIINWSYDYSDRSYKVTLESGDTATITYGDENITISQIITTEGDTITNNYTIYYLVDGSGSENPPSTCVHDWQETNTTPATCTVPGSKLSTCSKCQQTKKDPIPALGHDWQVKQTVTTEYDDTGQLIQQGYTIFECSRCHEQYKSSDGTIPPGGGSGTDPGGDEGETIWDKLGNLIGAIGSGVIGLIEAALGKVLDALIALVEGMMERLKTVVEAVLSIFDELPKLFGGFLDFLVAVFPFLPPELMTILTFGILAVVFIGIIKAVRR